MDWDEWELIDKIRMLLQIMLTSSDAYLRYKASVELEKLRVKEIEIEQSKKDGAS